MKTAERMTIVAALCAGVALAGEYPIAMPRMGTVRATGGFWAAREATNRLVTARANLKQSEDSGRIANFENAGKKIRGQAHGPFRGAFFNDSDVYKVAEGMAYELAHHPDAADEAALEDLVKKFIGAQEPDGYIYTPRTLGDRHVRVGDRRWYCDDAHELYCMGHLIEAAVAHHETTGRDDLLKAVCRTADMMRRTFGKGAGQIRFLPGHPEIELALCKLHRATGRRDYLDLALDLLDMRGLPKEARVGEVKRGFPNNRPYYQDHLPVREQREAVGHAVRACYLYAGMCEAGVLADDKGLLDAVDALWNDIVTKKLYLSGGVGARPEIEGFGPAYDLPNDHVCLETCAAIANALFNQRLFLRSGDAKHLDLIERIAYNGSLCSISIPGDEFFYPNPMASRGGYKRSKWFGCACCPPNVVRFIPQLINWTFASDAAKNTYYWNFFLTGEADLGRVRFSQTTDYPWSGAMKLTVNPAKDGDTFALKVRIPGWARGVPAPGGLYAQTKPSRAGDVRLAVNGRAVDALPGTDGFAVISGRAWKRGDTVELTLPMEVKRIRADDRIEADRNRLAVERGPLVYCAEGVDNGGKAFNAVLPPDAAFTTEPIEIASTKMVAVKGGGLTLVPFFAWCHRGAGEMQTWFPVSRAAAGGNSQGIIVRASHCWHRDTTDALFDGKLPQCSADESIPRFSFWPNCGKEDWIEIELPTRRPVRGFEVYWFDDDHAGRGGCSLPLDWKVQSRLFPGLPWTDVKGATYTTVRDGFSVAVFPEAINSEAFRIVVSECPGRSAGALELRVCETPPVNAQTRTPPEDPVAPRHTPEYRAVQERLCRGWNTWRNDSMTSHVFLPDGFAVNFGVLQEDGKYQRDILMRKQMYWKSNGARPVERVTPGLRSDDGRYTSLKLEFGDVRLKVETASDGEDLVALITPEAPAKGCLVVEGGFACERKGRAELKGDRIELESEQGRRQTLALASPTVAAGALKTRSPHLAAALANPVGVYVGRARTLEEIKNLVTVRRAEQERRVRGFGTCADDFQAMQTTLAWNSIYDPTLSRVITPVSRPWNQGWGGYVLFDWDTYFAAWMLSSYNRDLAYANAVEITKAVTADGFVPNWRGPVNPVALRHSGSLSGVTPDRSQPPVGALVVWEIYSRHHEKWFLKETYPELLNWNRWWPRCRDIDGYLAWGSHSFRNGKTVTDGLQGAKWESGLDNSPMYDNVPMHPDKHVMQLADVGLMSMYVKDCRTLAKIAGELGRAKERDELLARAERYGARLATLWDEKSGIYRNLRLDTGKPDAALSPCNFYPLLAGVCTPEQAQRMVREHYFNSDEFHGKYVMPSIARNCRGFSDNSYWRGRIWGPMNFLVYLGFRDYGLDEARKDLVRRSHDLLMENWRKNGGIYENYNSVTGEGADVRNADCFYHWGALLTFMGFLENEAVGAGK